MKWKPVVPVLVLVCATLGSATPLLAQAVQTSALSGIVRDTTGAVLPGATVTVSSPQQVGGVQTSVSDSQGVYRFPALRPGTYEMEAVLPGSRTSDAPTSSSSSAPRRRSTWPSRSRPSVRPCR
jgi:hypothetical protein